MIRVLLFRVLYWGPPFSETPILSALRCAPYRQGSITRSGESDRVRAAKLNWVVVKIMVSFLGFDNHPIKGYETSTRESLKPLVASLKPNS